MDLVIPKCTSGPCEKAAGKARPAHCPRSAAPGPWKRQCPAAPLRQRKQREWEREPCPSLGRRLPPPGSWPEMQTIHRDPKVSARFSLRSRGQGHTEMLPVRTQSLSARAGKCLGRAVRVICFSSASTEGKGETGMYRQRASGKACPVFVSLRSHGPTIPGKGLRNFVAVT